MSNPYQSPTAAADSEARIIVSTVEPPARDRWIVLLFLCTLALLLYIDRICIGQAETSIRNELGFSKEHMGWIFSAFMLAYCVFELPTGHWGDRFGSRGVIARIVVWWSIFTALTGVAWGFSSLVAIRFLFGAGEAGAFPNAARVVTRWFPSGERGFARGAITTTSMLGGAIAPPLAAALISAAGWRATFAIFGMVGIAWAALFYWWFRDDPAERSAQRSSEGEIIRPAQKDSVATHHDAIPWARVLASPNVWLLGTIMTAGATLFYTQFQWFSTYLKEARGLGEQQSSWCTGAVVLGGAAGCMVGGLLADFVTRRGWNRRWSRPMCGAGMLLLAFSSLWSLRFTNSVAAATSLNAAALFCLQVSLPTWWTVVAEISGKHGAAMFGLMNGLGGLGVMVMNYCVGRIVDARQAAGFTLVECWRPVFDGVALGLAVGAVCWMFVDATRPIVKPTRDE